jgi:hypothetical protein
LAEQGESRRKPEAKHGAHCQLDTECEVSAGFTGIQKGEISMKNIRTLLNIALLSVATSVCVQAQERPLTTVTVPFAFTVENSNLPAGSYTVSVLPPYNMIKLQSTDGRNVVMIRAIPSKSSADSKQAKFVFNRIGDEYFLSQVWELGSKTHRDLFLGNRAQELAKNRTNEQVKTVVAVAAH